MTVDSMFARWQLILGRVTATAAAFSAAAVAVLALVVAASFTMRSTFNYSIPGLIEFGETLMVLAVFFALAYGERMQSQIRMTLVTDYASPRVATFFRLIAMIVAMIIVIIFAVATAFAAWDSFQRGEVRFGLLRFPLWPARGMIAVGFLLLAIQYGTKAVQYVLDLVRRDYATYDYGVREVLVSRDRGNPAAQTESS